MASKLAGVLLGRIWVGAVGQRVGRTSLQVKGVPVGQVHPLAGQEAALAGQLQLERPVGLARERAHAQVHALGALDELVHFRRARERLCGQGAREQHGAALERARQLAGEPGALHFAGQVQPGVRVLLVDQVANQLNERLLFGCLRARGRFTWSLVVLLVAS